MYFPLAIIGVVLSLTYSLLLFMLQQLGCSLINSFECMLGDT